MFVDLKTNPELVSILNRAQGDQKSGQCEVRVFPEYGMTLASNWSDGTRYWYTLLNMVTKEQLPIGECGNLGQPKAPELNQLPPNFCLVEKVIFCGKKMFPRIYMNSANITKLLPMNELELTPEEAAFLKEYRSLKASYRPKNEALRSSLQLKGMLDNRGALTIAGKNYGR